MSYDADLILIGFCPENEELALLLGGIDLVERLTVKAIRASTDLCGGLRVTGVPTATNHSWSSSPRIILRPASEL